MANLRSSKRREFGAISTRSAQAANTLASSSSAKASHNLQSDENVPSSRRVLGNMKNVVIERQPAIEASGYRRRPFSDRNAPVIPDSSLVPSKVTSAAESRSRIVNVARSSLSRSTRTQESDSARSSTARVSTEPKPTASASASRRTQQAQLRSPLEQAKDVQVPSYGSLLAHAEDPMSSQIEAAGRRNLKPAPSHAELTRISPGLSSDDLEYFDISTLPQMQSAHVVRTTAQRGNTGSQSEDKRSNDGSAPSHGSSDKENLPPPAARASTRADSRHLARSRTDVLGGIGGDQPLHSTPISFRHQARDRQPVRSTYLDHVFLVESIHPSRSDSPGVARRAEPLTASAQHLEEYKHRGVTKVMAWKAAGHAEAFKTQQDASVSGKDERSAGFWPPSDAPGHVAMYDAAGEISSLTDLLPDSHENRGHRTGGASDSGNDEEDHDEFGFLTAERKIRDRRARTLGDDADRFATRRFQGDGSDVLVDVPTDPPGNLTSDDRRLAETAFGHMSSPVHQSCEELSAISRRDSVVLTRRHEAEEEQQCEVVCDEEEQAQVKVEAGASNGRLTRASTRASAKRESATAAVNSQELSTMSSPIHTHKRLARGARASKTVRDMRLKRSEKKDLAMLERLEAESWSSQVSSLTCSSSSPQPTGTTGKKASSSPAKRLRMDELVGELPRGRIKASNGKAKATRSSNKSKASTATTSKGRAGSARSKIATTGSRGRGKPAREQTRDEDQEDNEDNVSSDGETVGKRSKRGNAATSNKRTRKSTDQQAWRDAISSSQVHSDDSQHTRRLKEFRAAEKFHLEVELVL